MASSSNPSSCSCSSSCVPTRGSTYDIFLSFRGEDTRNNFVDHLYAALVQKGIHAFKDDQMLGGGKPISQSLLKAIKESKFAVVVFSKDYASSSWCLKELAEIMECHDQMGLKVLPVFYHVDPSDVRKQEGSFATAFQEHELNLNGEKNEVNKWREALTAAANLSGYHISPVSGGETTTINKIVQEISGDIPPRGREKDLIGIESHMDKVNLLLSIEATDVVRFIGIFGMGGIGKTTIARTLFRRISYKFDGGSFVHNVRENSSTKRDICALQEKILTDVLGAYHSFKIQYPEYGANVIEERFCNKKVFLVLDDVDNVDQLKSLAARHEWFGPGSRIIITTRDEHLLVDTNDKYKPALLHMDQALELFSKHAFKKNSPPDEFKELSNRVIHYTGHLPLALKVLGSFFCGRDIDEWESAIGRLAKTPNSEILQTLKLSYDGLEELEKKIFLDIACFFKGKEVDDVTRVLNSCDFFVEIGLRVLIEKSLITISRNKIDMHDLIQEMGLQVVSQSARDSRLWNYEKIHDIIIENKRLENIEAIVNTQEFLQYLGESGAIVNRLIHNVFRWKGCSADAFKHMKNLRLLEVGGNFTCCKPTFLPHELQWLHWYEYPFSSLPLSNMCKLGGLKIYHAKIKHLWKGQKIMPNLKFIQLYWLVHLSRFPNVSRASNIERLCLNHCINLVEVHESLGLLKMLVYLEIRMCFKLERLPSKFEMESLETLILDYCPTLKRLPEFSPCMVKLSRIDITDCYNLKELPSSIKNISNLRILNLSCCKSLKVLPEEEYEWLQQINLNDCKKLLEVNQNERYLDKMLKQSFLKKWAARDGCLSITIPRSKIPSWFKEQQNGSEIELKLPFKWQTQIIGFAICGVFWRGPCGSPHDVPSIRFRFEHGGTLAKRTRMRMRGVFFPNNNEWHLVPISEVDSINACATSVVEEENENHNKNMWIGYVPLSLLENMHHNNDDDNDCACEDWSRIIEGSLFIELKFSCGGTYCVRCGALAVYKEEVESSKEIIKSSIASSHYWNWKLEHDHLSPNTIVCWGYE